MDQDNMSDETDRYRSTIMSFSARKLSVVPAERFPEGVQDAWMRLKGRVGSLRGRRFYGVIEEEGDRVLYYAGVESQSEGGMLTLGLPVLDVPGGEYARVRLLDWQSRTAEFAEIFDCLIHRHGLATRGFCLEYYRSEGEVQLLVPVPKSTRSRPAE